MRITWFSLLLLGIAASQNTMAADIEQFFMPGELIAGHQDLQSECTNCHVRLRDTTQKALCLGCHEHQPVAEDIEKNRGFHGRDSQAKSLDCKSCHSDHKGPDARIVWLDRDLFDHRSTDYPLTGKHKVTACAGCHLENEKYRQAKNGCFDCHAEDDAHDGQLGKQCESCHVTLAWGQSEFDHDKTDFKLKAAHQQVNCNACHIENRYQDTPKQCVDCHAIRDVHANRFGNQCESCHQEQGWDKSVFDHDRDTGYPLEGKHRGPPCNDCHARDYRPPAKQGVLRSCYSCHRSDDVHNASNGKKCQDCHVVRGWAYAEFDHAANTDFALIGGHFDLTCEACHAIGAETKKIDTACYSCHKQDDVHKREQGTECNLCHKEVAWQHDVRFDHDLSRFPLIGQHAVVGCEACHQNSVFTDTESQCVACHGGDDIHEQGLGDDCARCHNSNDWLIWNFDHDETDFKLRHAHAEVHCHRCHNKPRKEAANRGQRCVDCHRRDDIHDGQFGGHCNRCHSDESFEVQSLRSLTSFGSNKDTEAPE